MLLLDTVVRFYRLLLSKHLAHSFLVLLSISLVHSDDLLLSYFLVHSFSLRIEEGDSLLTFGTRTFGGSLLTIVTIYTLGSL